MTIRPDTLAFLRDLKQNNNRPWFQAEKARYLEAYGNLLAFTERLIVEMQKHDQIVPRSPKQSLFRIYRDIRFSKDKTPYKTGFMGSLKRATRQLRGGYYFNIEPGGETAVVGGFWRPNSTDLRRIRQEIDADPESFRAIFDDSRFKRNFGQLHGEALKTAPQGYTKDHPAIDLLRKKQFLLIRRFADKQVTSGGFARSVVATFLAMRPFFDHMSEILSTDENGVPLF